jgi:transposase-like protein
MQPLPHRHYRHLFPAEIYHVFSFSLRDVELMLTERGIAVSYETVRGWCRMTRFSERRVETTKGQESVASNA